MTILPFLMFEGQAAEAMEFYVSLFPDSRVLEVERFGPGEEGVEGTIKRAIFTIAGQQMRCFDSYVHHAFTFTPAWSSFVECEHEAEQERLYQALAEGGQVLMPLDDYGFSRRFGWVNDRFGVSWQVNLA
jgi:predicted 3-demethylubiquinone-9 3-methyltransferase (glyoxalase superfamily)